MIFNRILLRQVIKIVVILKKNRETNKKELMMGAVETKMKKMRGNQKLL
jgi:hypothetical protein